METFVFIDLTRKRNVMSTLVRRNKWMAMGKQTHNTYKKRDINKNVYSPTQSKNDCLHFRGGDSKISEIIKRVKCVIKLNNLLH